MDGLKRYRIGWVNFQAIIRKLKAPSSSESIFNDSASIFRDSAFGDQKDILSILRRFAQFVAMVSQ
jgi:hypothetical protein